MKLEMKYCISALIVIALLWYPFTQGDSRTTMEQMSEAVSAAVDENAYQLLDEMQIRKYFKIDVNEADGILAYRAKDAMSAETLIILRLHRQEDGEAIMEKLRAYIDSEHVKYDGYSPDQVGILDNYTMIEKKGYIFLSISENKEWQRIFETNL